MTANGSRKTLADVIEQRALDQPDKVFMWIDDDRYTYDELRRRTRLTAHALEHLGLSKGEVVASFTRTCFDTVALLLGASRAGAVFMAVNTAFRGEYLIHQLRDARARIVLVDEDLLPHLEPLADQLPDLQVLLVRADAFTSRVLGHVTVQHAEVLLTGDADKELRLGALAWNEPAFVFYTSGTTGASKGALVTQNYLLTIADLFLRNFGLRRDDVQYAAVPLFHVSGAFSAVITALAGGHTTVLDTSFHVTTCWDRVRALNATIFFGVGAMVMMLWNLPPDPRDADLPIRTMLSAPIPPELWRPIEQRYGCEILSGFGQTEAVQIAAQVTGEDNVPGSCGRPISCFDVRIFDENDAEVPAGTPGEIVIRPRESHVMFEGYLGRPEDTLRQMRNLWFHTGDLGRFGADGNLWFVDRKKDAIRRRGENISSSELETTITRFNAVGECAAFGVRSDLIEEDVMVTVVAASGEIVDPVSLMDYCVEHLPRFAVPRYIEVVESLPKTVTGRVQKHLLRSGGVGPRTWDAVATGYHIPREGMPRLG